MAEVQFLGFRTSGFPDPDVTRDVRPTNPPEVSDIGVVKDVVSPGQTASIDDAPDVTFAKVLPPVPQSVSPAEGTTQPLSELMRPSSQPGVAFPPPSPAPIPTTTVIPVVMDASGDLPTLFGGASLTQAVGQTIRFPASTRTAALRDIARRILSALLDASGFVLVTLDAPLPAAPIGRRDITDATNTNGGAGGTPVPISGATNTAPIIIDTGVAHGLVTGIPIVMTGVGGNIAANGPWTITVTDPTHFTLNGSDGTLSGAYVPATGQYTTPIIITTSTPHGYVTGDQVVVSNVSGNTDANNTWTIFVLDALRFMLVGSTAGGPAAYVAATGSVYGPHDIFFIEENPSTVVAHLFGPGNIVAQEPDATIYDTVPSKEVILS